MMSIYIGLFLALLSTLFGASSSIIIKKSLQKGIQNSWKAKITLLAGLGIMGIGVLMVFIALKFGEVSIIYPVTAITFVWTTLFGKKYLQETITTTKIIGVAIIIIGVALLTI